MYVVVFLNVNVSKVFMLILFADDTNLFYCDSNLNELSGG